MLVGDTKVQAQVDAELHGSRDILGHENPSGNPESPNLPRFPVIIFSHGLATTRSSYSHLCGELAS